MMKIAVLLYQNMRHAPFLKFYEGIFREMEDVEYDVIYLDRHPELNEPDDVHHIPISWIGRDDHNVFAKFLTCATYPARVRRKLKAGKYDFIFALTTMPGGLLNNYLLHDYSGKYLLDIRDYTKEHIKAYFKAEMKVVRNSAINVISSPDYVKFLPTADYHMCHNLNLPEKESNRIRFEKSPSKRVVIAYVGSIQYADYCFRLIKLVEEDERFEFHFYGPEGGDLKITNYVNGLGNLRISMKGRFKPEEKEEIFTQSDLIFNCYGNDNNIVKYAISNKYYDAAYFRRPLIVSPNTTMSRLCGRFAFPIDLAKVGSLDDLYKWYRDIDSISFEQYCASIINAAQMDNFELEKLIRNKLHACL